MGATKVKRDLGTDSLSLANQLKWAVIKDLKDVIRSFESNGGSDVSRGARNVALRQAADIAAALRPYTPESHLELSRDIVEAKVDAVRGACSSSDISPSTSPGRRVASVMSRPPSRLVTSSDHDRTM